jgi:protein gp37
MSSTNTGIEWTDKTWNPTTGCDKVSPGCIHCYAETITKRFANNFPNGFNLTLHDSRLLEPIRWKQPSRIFVNSMSDLFHEKVPTKFIKEVFYTIEKTPWHIYQVLTKRHQRIHEISRFVNFPKNLWLGVSVETQDYVHRIDFLRDSPANVKFISCEPLLGSLKLNLSNINWVIVGGESGQNYRPIKTDWVRSIRDQCLESGTAFFFKQVGGRTPKSGGALLDGKIWNEIPKTWENHLNYWEDLKVKSIRDKAKLELIA